MDIKTYSKHNLHSVIITFDKNEKCFCCSKVFDKKTDVVQTFSTRKEFEEYVSNLAYNFNIKIK